MKGRILSFALTLINISKTNKYLNLKKVVPVKLTKNKSFVIFNVKDKICCVLNRPCLIAIWNYRISLKLKERCFDTMY